MSDYWHPEWSSANTTTTWRINGVDVNVAAVPEMMRCQHIMFEGPACTGGCYTRASAGPWKCDNLHCIGHRTKCEFQCFGTAPFLYNHTLNFWRKQRAKAKHALPAADYWALEVIVYGDNVIRMSEAQVREVAAKFQAGDTASTGRRIVNQDDDALQKVWDFERAAGIPLPDMSRMNRILE
ncbi:hypothetical protein NA57DRAFT_81599 [Rhizodiscina lignyota]|uniref:Uncharacterized protein n=1 Tax=Rhizodiscina lignyota TaxID=1504668 RepID=A0A9P4I5E5_9PEZI|nr:hypothetical protein NA57DRAFT_81599 [Rhizodiscina lignyota]